MVSRLLQFLCSSLQVSLTRQAIPAKQQTKIQLALARIAAKRECAVMQAVAVIKEIANANLASVIAVNQLRPNQWPKRHAAQSKAWLLQSKRLMLAVAVQTLLAASRPVKMAIATAMPAQSNSC